MGGCSRVTRWSALLTVLALGGCGSKSGLTVGSHERDGGMDAARDAGMDAGRDASWDAGADAGCVPFRAEARLAALDIFVMMDSSGSMAQRTAGGETKAEAVTEAFRGFSRAPESDGIGVALTFFPFERSDVPKFCTEDDACGEPDACFRPDICLPSGEQACRTDADCDVAGDTCEWIGRCEGRSDVEDFCLPAWDLSCPPGDSCVELGYCLNKTSCDVDDYRRPSVDLGLLPGVGPDILSALETRELVGSTPTRPALEGALARAGAWSVDNPGSKVIVLLATDGFPSICDPTIDPWEEDPSAGIEAVSRAAAAGEAEGLQTFVIGVFTPEEEAEARANLTAIAVAGGTEEALVITTDEPVTERLLAILEELRRTVRTCIYAIPHEGVLPDPYELEVRIVPPDAPPIELERRDGPEDCDPADGGFFFERDIGAGARPGYIELCPASCSLTAASSDFVVEMQDSCE